jgi:hypothetical protein
MKSYLRGASRMRWNRVVVAIVLALCSICGALRAGNPANPILFVTQTPMPEEVNSRDVLTSYQSCVSPFSNHLADTAHAGRGGSLYIRFNDGQIINMLNVADWTAISGGQPAANTVAVRNPAVNWTADKAIFSMVIGAPSSPTDTTVFTWQLYEITLPTQVQLNNNVKPVITKVANQPAYNNVFPCYASGGKILFSSDRPYNGQSHLTQREEYLGLPTVSGVWSLDPSNANSLRLLHHSPSGGFSPMVDSSGRVIFTNWDHLSRDSEAVTDSRAGDPNPPYNEPFTQTNNGSGNFASEVNGAAFTNVTSMAPETWDIFPEPRNFDHKTLIDVYGGKLNGNAFNIFLPWMMNQDGTTVEIINHVGRQEVSAGIISRNFNTDNNLVDLNPNVNPGYGGLGVHNFFGNLMWTREDPANPGTFYGSDAADLGTHGAGQIVKMNNAGAGQNPDNITITYITAGATAAKPGFIPIVKPSINLPPTGIQPLTNAETLYRTPVPLKDGNLIASHAGNITQTDYNSGTVSQPATFFNFRLKSLKASGQSFIPDIDLTAGITINTSYYVGSTLVSYNGPAWELDPAEVVTRTEPAATTSSVAAVETGVFNAVGVHIPTFQNYLVGQNAALTVSRNVTKRDQHDRQQPFNLKIAWSNTQTVGTGGTIYTVGWVQFLQADLLRGYLLGAQTPASGRRVVATPLHDTMAENVQTQGAPAGSLRLGDDGSFAAIVPARKAMTWQLLDNDTAKTSQVKERFWVTFQPGEIRTCANCHGINTADQAGSGSPTNPPQALTALLQQWKTSHPPGIAKFTQTGGNASVNLPSLTAQVSRTAGSTGPVTISYSTVDGTAQAGVDFTAPVNATLNWADGDTATKTISIPLINTSFAGQRTFTIVLSNPQYGSLGTPSSFNATLSSSAGGNSAPSNLQTQPSVAAINEGDAMQLSGSFADADAQDTHTVDIDWGDGSTHSAVQLAAGVTLFNTSHTYVNNPAGAPQGSFTITSTVSDAAATSSPSTASIQVNNLAPVASIGGTPQSVAPNTAVSLTSSVTDPGTSDTFTYAWSVTKGGAAFASGTQSTFSFTPDAVGTFAVSLTVTDSDGATANSTASVDVSAPIVINSGPAADPAPGVVGSPVTFSINVNPSDASIVWDFGDGTMASGASATHTFTSAGNFDIVATITDSLGKTKSASLTLQVVALAAGGETDTDGDGFSDEVETAAGTSPTNSADTPFGGQSAGTALPLTLTKLSISLNFSKPGNDSLQLAGSLPVGAGFTMNGQKVILDVGGVARSFTLSSKGQSAPKGVDSFKIGVKSKKGVVAAQQSKFAAKFSKGNFASKFVDEGLVNGTAAAAPVSISVSIVFNGAFYQTLRSQTYTAKPQKIGASKDKKK